MNDLAAMHEYFAHRDDVLLAYVFGSRASDRSSPESDYDVAVLTQSPITPARRFQMASELCRLLNGVPIDLLSLNESPIELAYAVVVAGRRVYERDLAARVEFEAYVLSRYGDMVHMLREQHADLLRGGRYEAGVRRNRAALGQTERVLAEVRATARSTS